MFFGGETAESYYDEGLTSFMKGEIEQAIKHFERALQLDSSLNNAHHQLGKCYTRMGQPQEAIKHLQQALRNNPNLVPARVDLGYALLDMQAPEQARDVFFDVAALKPDNARAQLGLADCAYQAGQWDAAISLAQTALNFGGANFAAYYLLGRAAAFEKRIDISAQALNRADALMEKSIETNPDQPEAYFLRGEVHYAQEAYMKAIEFYHAAEERAVAGKRYNAFGERFNLLDIKAKRGLALQQFGEKEAAREVGAEILKSDPGHPLGRMLTGQ